MGDQINEESWVDMKYFWHVALGVIAALVVIVLVLLVSLSNNPAPIYFLENI